MAARHRAIRRDWKGLLAAGAFLLLLTFCLHQIHLAWAEGAASSRWAWITFEDGPTLFIFAVALLA
ncbi:MAG: hypothetical protein IT536_20520 [Hyphomicrobiales bacterium]|nr:hypothetical protein [Hyphomicrobiales bacterium]